MFLFAINRSFENRSFSNQQTTTEYWDSFHTSSKLRMTMINISKRLTQMQELVIVDTHCHFDLIFDRYFDDSFYQIIYL